ncbi:MAG: hypothetical protein AB1458_02675 [Bacteroidota bacterium]
MKKLIPALFPVFVSAMLSAQTKVNATVFPAVPVSEKNDTAFFNTSKLKAYVLFDTETAKTRFRLMDGQARPMQPKGKDFVAFWFFTPGSKAIDYYLMLDSAGARRGNAITPVKGDTLNSYVHTHAPYGVVVNDTDWVPKYIVDTTHYSLEIGKITVITYPDGCADTGRNDVIIETPGGTMKFTRTFNVMLFEHDATLDGKKELYLCVYRACEGHFKIYRISP